MSHRSTLVILVGVLVGGVLAFAPPSVAQGVRVALTPTGSQVEPGAVFDLDIVVTEAGAEFNGFDAVIGYDPDALTLVPRAPISLQEGSLMRDACGMTFHRFRQGASTDTLTDILLCGGVALTGPGQVYHLQFRASTTPQITVVRFLPGLHFYNAGIYVTPVMSTNATVGIGMSPAAVESDISTKSLQLHIAPNPTQGDMVFSVGADRPGPQQITVFDLRGRVVREFADSMVAAGARKVPWDGRDSLGNRLPAGVYFVMLRADGRSVSDRVTLVH